MDKFVCKDLPMNKKMKKSSRSSKKLLMNSSITLTTQATRNALLNDAFTPSKKIQSYLDFGQKSFGRSLSCPKCNMIYVAGVEEDEKNHVKFCQSRQHVNIDSLSVKMTPTIIRQHFDVAWDNPEKGTQILKIDMDSDYIRKSLKSSAQRLRDVVGAILRDMGAHDSAINETGCTLYLYIETLGGVVKGLILSELVPRHDLFLFCHKEMFDRETPNIRNSSENSFFMNGSHTRKFPAFDQASDINPSPVTDIQESFALYDKDYLLLSPSDLLCKRYHDVLEQVASTGRFTCGVKQMWVSSKCRRQGIAHQLLECVRASASVDSRYPLFISSYEKFKIAFSQPTSDGLMCAMNYVAPSKALLLYSRSTLNCENTPS